jgi:hypothetical protein
MGLTAENVHVFVQDGFPGAVRNRVAEAAKNFLRRQGYLEVADPSAADRTVTLGPVDGRRWIAVFDTETGSAPDLAKALSKDAATAAVSMMVSDSDDVFVRLAEGGKLAAAFERSEGKTRHKDVPRWAPYADLDALREVFAGEPLFAEDQLARLAETLGMDRVLCLTPAGEAEGEEFLSFHFRHKNTRGGEPKEASGPPVFQVPHHGYRPFELGVGERLWGSMGAYATNVGGPGTGVRITVSGTAIEEGLVRVDSATVFQPARPERIELPLQSHTVEVPGLRMDGGAERPEPRANGHRVSTPEKGDRPTRQYRHGESVGRGNRRGTRSVDAHL